jgi:hypothetical protein
MVFLPPLAGLPSSISSYKRLIASTVEVKIAPARQFVNIFFTIYFL